MKNWKLAAELFRLALNAPEQSDVDPAEYDDVAFDLWHKCATDFLAARTNTEQCDAARKTAIASILDQFKQGKTLVRSEQAYIQNGDSGWDWVGRLSLAGTVVAENLIMFHTYDTVGDEGFDEEYVEKDIFSEINNLSTDCLCAVADNLYA